MDSIQQELHDNLKLAKSLIADEKNWIKGASAKNADGSVVSAWDDDAVCFCSIGAALKADTSMPGYMYDALFKACKVIDPNARNISQFNDTHTHAEVMQMWDIAIKSTQPKENHG